MVPVRVWRALGAVRTNAQGRLADFPLLFFAVVLAVAIAFKVGVPWIRVAIDAPGADPALTSSASVGAGTSAAGTSAAGRSTAGTSASGASVAATGGRTADPRDPRDARGFLGAVPDGESAPSAAGSESGPRANRFNPFRPDPRVTSDPAAGPARRAPQRPRAHGRR